MILLEMDRRCLTYLVDCGGFAPTIAIPARLFHGQIPLGTPDLVAMGLIEHRGDITRITDAGRMMLGRQLPRRPLPY